MTDPRPVVGVVGTFDVANFGDLLFPLLVEHELARRVGPIEVRRFSHRPMRSPPWPYEVRPIGDLILGVDELDLLVVGGGHLVRFDATVAPNYEAVETGIPHPGGYWLSPSLLAASAGVPVAWNAVGVSPGTPSWARPLLARVLDAVDYLAVRDGDSLAELQAVSPTSQARIVPDSAFGIAAYLEERTPAPTPAEAAIAGRPYVIVQPSKGLRPIAGQLLEALPALQRAGIAVVELPISPVLGDEPGLLGPMPDGTVRVEPWPEPAALARLIAGAKAVVAHSFHCSVVALAHGVPLFRAATPEGTKYHALGSFAGVRTVGDQDDLATALLEAQRRPASSDVVEQLSQLGEHWDRLAGLLEAREPAHRRDRQAAARRTIVELPALLAGIERDADVRVREAVAEETQRLEGQRAAVSASLARANDRALALAERISALEVDVARERSQADADRRRAAEELERRRKDLAATRAELRPLQRKAASYDRMRQRRLVRVAAGVLRVGRQVLDAVGVRRAPVKAGKQSTPAATEGQERALAEALRAAAPGSPRTDGPQVSIIVLNRDGAHHLRRLLPAIERSTYRSFELIVVDNGSTDGSIDLLTSSQAPAVNLIRNAENEAFGEANNRAVAAATGELMLFLNNDVEPLGPGWLGRLVTTLEERSAGAVGARLVYPRRPDTDNAGDRPFPDLTLQHRGIAMVPADGIPTGKNLGTGEDPTTAVAAAVTEVPGVTAACMLVRREAFDGVGGFTAGYTYGTEDVDLCLKLRAAGHSILYDGGAVLWHHEYGTQNAQGREWKKQNRVRNRQRWVDRWGPQVFRSVLRDRLLGEGRWSVEPLHVAITVTRDDPAAGWGDLYTAHELGDALTGLGWRVTYAERYRERWYELDPSVDVVISLLDQFDVRRIRRGVITIAWIRNWTDRWVGHPWFDEYDIVLVSSERSRQIVEDRTAKQPKLMPLATNAARFGAGRPSPDLAADVVFAGNSWGKPREIESVLPAVAADRTIAVYGQGWESTPLSRFHRGSLPYERLPDAYASAGIVVDDTAGPTLPYGAVNSRVFDALAAGALVVSDNDVGVRELFGDRLPIVRDGDALRRILDWSAAQPEEARALRESLRATVLEQHTYEHRASEIRDHLLAWVDAERYGILVGIPDWDQAETWGDLHFARAMQRQLERRGHPTRIHLLDEWGRSPSARADVVVHLHGLSDHRTRPSQLSVLWIISHPDRVTPGMCEKYDLVVVASTTFATELAGRVSVPVFPLHQATDPDRFKPDRTGPDHELLFVGNARRSRRAILDDLLPTTHDLAVYGKGWTSDLVDPLYVRGDHIPNDKLARHYASARIVLNDHWADMRARGFLSNRLYDVLASGGFVISDAAAGIDAEFDGAVVAYTDREDLRRLIDQYLTDDQARQALAERGRRVVLARHTFGHRIERLLEIVDGLPTVRPRTVERWADIEAWLARSRRAAPVGAGGGVAAAVKRR
jgi:GT2 family glycosyltransferase/spore maturation protein CgeB